MEKCEPAISSELNVGNLVQAKFSKVKFSVPSFIMKPVTLCFNIPSFSLYLVRNSKSKITSSELYDEYVIPLLLK